MKKLIFLTIALLLSAVSYAQILKPVKWSYAAKKTGKNEATIYLKATLDKGWHIYSLHMAEGGPVKTTISLSPSKLYRPEGLPLEPRPVTVFEKVFNMKVSYFSNTVIFQQKVKLSKPTAVVKGNIEYMACNDQQCLPPADVAFSIPIR
ncbi:MAG: protein-disulfide reductase DsbD domain-containing protein [Adhaeribacter sp.]